MAIPRTLASTGELKIRRRDALRLTGRLFQLRRDVNLVSNVLDVPELFWSEASLKDLYDAVREYMEINPRVQVLNEKLAVTNDLVCLTYTRVIFDVLTRYVVGPHSRAPQQFRYGEDNVDHYLVSDHPPAPVWNTSDSTNFRLIVVACVVEFGEVMARLIVHATVKGEASSYTGSLASNSPLSGEHALLILERMMKSGQQ